MGGIVSSSPPIARARRASAGQARRSGLTRPDLLLPTLLGLLGVGLMLVWAVHDGGYDEETWLWGGLAMLALNAGALCLFGSRTLTLRRCRALALLALTIFTAWSFATMLWASSPGLALLGSDKVLLYLLTFSLFALVPWSARGAFLALLTFTVGVGATAVVLLTRLAIGSDVGVLFVGGRLAAPTGYINSTAALFTMGALLAVGFATRRELWAPVRGALLAGAAAELDLAITVQSRGWLFTLPFVALVAIIVVPSRLRVTVAAVLPVLGAAVDARRLLRVYEDTTATGLGGLAQHAARPALVICCAVFLLATFGALLDSAFPVTLGRWSRRVIGLALAVIAIGGGVAVLEVVSSSHPASFISHQWHGFAHPESDYSGSHFSNVGSGRYDFWRVAVDAFLAHPVGGIGQNNFGDYYLLHGRSGENPNAPHSLEMSLLSETGAVGTALFLLFGLLALREAAHARRDVDEFRRFVTAAALLPLLPWLLHGSVDWFWEMPAISAPALGFLGLAVGLSRTSPDPAVVPARRTDVPVRVGRRWLAGGATAALLGVALVVLAFPYLSVREVSVATDIQNAAPQRSLADLADAGRLDPLDSTPGLVAGAVALRNHEWQRALDGFTQSTDREPRAWLSWLGAGLARSALGDRAGARTAFVRAHAIDHFQPVTAVALARVDTRHPLSSEQAFNMLDSVS